MLSVINYQYHEHLTLQLVTRLTSHNQAIHTCRQVDIRRQYLNYHNSHFNSSLYTQCINNLSLRSRFVILNMIVHLIFLLTQTLIFLSIPSLINTSQLDYDTLVFKQCDSSETNILQKTIKYPNYLDQSLLLRAQAVSSFLHKLESEASRSKFYKTLVGNEEHAVSGWFQCREDYPSDICHRCVGDLGEISSRMCGNATSARVHLRGCHLKYEIELVGTPSARKYLIIAIYKKRPKILFSMFFFISLVFYLNGSMPNSS